MEIVNFTPLPALLGGVMIGTATALVLLLNGKVAGISGVVGRILRGVPGDTAWRVDFVAGLVLGGAVVFRLFPETATFRTDASWLWMGAAGLLVGIGTRVGGGCTSGHGVCGIASGSRRGIAATLTFMAVALATVYLVRHVLMPGGAA